MPYDIPKRSASSRRRLHSLCVQQLHESCLKMEGRLEKLSYLPGFESRPPVLQTDPKRKQTSRQLFDGYRLDLSKQTYRLFFMFLIKVVLIIIIFFDGCRNFFNDEVILWVFFY